MCNIFSTHARVRTHVQLVQLFFRLRACEILLFNLFIFFRINFIYSLFTPRARRVEKKMIILNTVQLVQLFFKLRTRGALFKMIFFFYNLYAGKKKKKKKKKVEKKTNILISALKGTSAPRGVYAILPTTDMVMVTQHET